MVGGRIMAVLKQRTVKEGSMKVGMAAALTKKSCVNITAHETHVPLGKGMASGSESLCPHLTLLLTKRKAWDK